MFTGIHWQQADVHEDSASPDSEDYNACGSAHK